MTQEESKASVTLSESKADASGEQTSKGKVDKREKHTPPTKVVIRRLPPSMNQETFLDQTAPVPEYDYVYFVRADMSLGQFAFSRAYINFVNYQDVFLFKEKFDGYVFVDSKGNEYPAVVEFAPFQKVPKKKAKKDSKCGTIEQDPDYIKFVESWNKPDDTVLPTAEFYLEEIENREREMRAHNGDLTASTPLIEYLRQRRAEKQRIREEKREERRRRDLEKKRIKEEERRRRKVEKEKERERLKEKCGKESDGDKSSAGFKTSKDGPVKLLKNPEREKAKENETVEVKDGASRDNVDVRNKVRTASGDKYSRSSSYHSAEYDSERRPQTDSKLKVKDKFRDRKDRDRHSKKGIESTVHHTSKFNAEVKKDADDRDISKKSFTEQASSSAKKIGGRGGKSYERTRESLARSRESRVTFECTEDRPTDLQKGDIKSNSTKDESKTAEDEIDTNKSDVNTLEGDQYVEESGKKEEENESSVKSKSSKSTHDNKSDRRIRNKDRPSMEIYRPGMRRFSLQRNSPQKDSPSSSSSPSPTAQLLGKPLHTDQSNTVESPTDSGQNSPSDEQHPIETIVDGCANEESAEGNEMDSEITLVNAE